ncbi:MAG: hypothetical protein HFG99_09820 [Dorea sp.]|jgi:hypothetical protein|nr:hypothetical protein [Dorea sp.]
MLSVSLDVHAREDVKQIDGSYLMDKDESIGYATPITRGDDLVVGYSKCVRLANGNLYVGGSTLAAHPVERIGIAVIVERAKEEDTEWETYDSWIVHEENEEWLSSTKELNVEGGYYYRVRCIHSAGNDMSSSFTDGLFFE